MLAAVKCIFGEIFQGKNIARKIFEGEMLVFRTLHTTLIEMFCKSILNFILNSEITVNRILNPDDKF